MSEVVGSKIITVRLMLRQHLVYSALHICGFLLHRINQLWIKNIQKKKFQGLPWQSSG